MSYRDRRKFGTRQGDHEAPQVLALKLMGNRARIEGILDCTSNSEENGPRRYQTHTQYIHHCDVSPVCERGAVSQRTDANDNKPLRSPNCVHYVTEPVGEHLKYLVTAQGRPVALLGWCSSPRHIGCRDRYIGWSKEARRRNIRYVVYNTRFLILTWVRVPHLGSHILGRMAKIVARDWQAVYGHRVYFLETFVDPGRFRGTCYRAANWMYLGRTTGRGKDSVSKQPNRSIKEVLGYPLHKRFRKLLGGVGGGAG